MAKQLFGIFSPQLGERKDYPVILLEKTVQVDNQNIIRKYGEVRRRQMRAPDMLQTSEWISPTGHSDPSSNYSNEENAYDGNTGSVCYCDPILAESWSGYLELTFDEIEKCSKVRIYSVIMSGDISLIQIDYHDGSDWVNFYDGEFISSGDSYDEYGIGDTVTTSKIRFRFYNNEISGEDTIRISDVGVLEVEKEIPKQTPDGNPIIHYHTFTKRSTATQYILAFTKAHIYLWDTSGEEWIQKFECSADCTEWDTATYNDKVIATNNVDKVLVWDTTGDFVALDDTVNGIEYSTGVYLTRAKYVTTFENFLILGYTYENDISHPQRIRWNAIGDETSWSTGDAGSAETEGSDFITGLHIYSGQLVIFKEQSRILQRLVSSSDVWVWDKMPGNIGCISNHSIVEDPDGRIFWLANDMTFREMQTGEISHDIDPIVKLIEPSSDYLVYGAYIDETGEIWWSIPYDNALNNKVLTYKNGAWGELDLAIPAIGAYKEV